MEDKNTKNSQVIPSSALSLEPAGSASFTAESAFSRNKQHTFLWFMRRFDIFLAVLLVMSGAIIIFNPNQEQENISPASRFSTVNLPLRELIEGRDLSLPEAASVTINGSMQLNNALILSPSPQPTGAKPGQIYYDQTTNQLAYFNGEVFVFLNTTIAQTNGIQSLGGATGELALGSGLSVGDGQLSNAGVLSVQGQTGAVTFNAGPGVAINGTTVSNNGVITVSSGSPNVAITDDGAGNVTVSMVGGAGTISSPGGTIGSIPVYTAAQIIADSIITQSGLAVTVGGNLNVTGTLNLSNPLSVGNGGTGATSHINNGVLVGQGSSAMASVSAGGAGLCLLSTVGLPVWGVCPSGGGVTTLNGLSGALNIANSSAAGSTITIDDATNTTKGIASFSSSNFTVTNGGVDTIQSINPTATPTFAAVNTNNITPSGTLTVGSATHQLNLQGNAATSLAAMDGGNTVRLAFATPTTNVTYRLQTATAGTYDICTTAGNCTASANSLQAAYDAGNTIVTTSSRDILFSLADTTIDANYIIDLQCDTSCGSNGRFALQDDGTDVFTVNAAAGTIFIQPTVDSATALNLKSSIGNNQFTIDSQNGRVGIALGASVTPTLQSTGLEIRGAIRLSGASGTYTDLYVTPLGSSIQTAINIINYDPGAAAQLVALGLPVGANATSRALTVLDGRSGAHQPSIAVISPDEQQIGGFSWEGTNTDFSIKNTAAGAINLHVGGANRLTTTTTGTGINMTPSTSALDISTVNATDRGLRITGVVAQSANLFQLDVAGAGTVASVSGVGATLLRNLTNSVQAFQVLNASSVPQFTVDTSNSRAYVGSPTADTTGALLVLDNKTNDGDPTGVDGAMYYNQHKKSVRCYINGNWRTCSNGAVFTQSGIGVGTTISNTTTSTPFDQTYTIPSNECTSGKVYRITASGRYSTTGTPTLKLTLKMGGTAIGGTGDIPMPSSVASSGIGWKLQSEIVCYSGNPAVSGNMNTHGDVSIVSNNAGTATIGAGWPNDTYTSGVITMNTTAAQTLSLEAQWSAASTANYISLYQFTVEALGP